MLWDLHLQIKFDISHPPGIDPEHIQPGVCVDLHYPHYTETAHAVKQRGPWKAVYHL